MRFCVWLLSLLLYSPFLSAQHEANASTPQQQTRRLEAGTTSNLSQVQIKKRETEQGLKKLIELHTRSLENARPQVRRQIEQSLYRLFDLNLELLQKEARRMRHELDQMESKSNGTDEVARLKRALREVESRIAFRQENRVQIVSARLNQVLDQG